MKRLSVVSRISHLLDNQCSGCLKRDELIEQHGSTFSRIDGYCNKDCTIGQQLQALGGLLRRDCVEATHIRGRSKSEASGCGSSVSPGVAVIGNAAPQVPELAGAIHDKSACG
ncbi:zinc-finger domain-containing protein [Paenibacillus sp. CAU 1782]